MLIMGKIIDDKMLEIFRISKSLLVVKVCGTKLRTRVIHNIKRKINANMKQIFQG